MLLSVAFAEIPASFSILLFYTVLLFLNKSALLKINAKTNKTIVTIDEINDLKSKIILRKFAFLY